MLIQAEKTFAMIVDIQEKLLPHIENNQELIKNTSILIKGLKLLNIPMILNEQYPKGLGETVKEIAQLVPDLKPFVKTTFSCCANAETKQEIESLHKNNAIVFGTESHVCVMQTCLDLLANDIRPILITDCMGSRKEKDHKIALTRLVELGATVATYESILFELCRSSKNPNFKQISALVK